MHLRGEGRESSDLAAGVVKPQAAASSGGKRGAEDRFGGLPNLVHPSVQHNSKTEVAELNIFAVSPRR